MEDTRVDNTFIEMIQPRVDEIKERFSRAEELSLEDVNTLLLQSQYNHINHLDAHITRIDGRIDGINGRIDNVEGGVKELSHEFRLMEERVNTRFAEMDAKFEARFEQVNTRFAEMDAKFEARFEQVNTRFEQVNTKFEEVNTRIERMQNVLLRNMVFVMGGMLTLFKVIDLLIK